MILGNVLMCCELLNGSIDSNTGAQSTTMSSGFQFLNGSIDSTNTTRWNNSVRIFQFLNGSIDSLATRCIILRE